MKITAFIGFTKKEFIETVRTGKLFFLLLLFSLFGIMAPAVAKLTPWLMEAMSESLEETGIVITEIKVDALTSWAQFYKNIPIAFLIFFLMFHGILTIEYQKKTLVPIITKGMQRWKIIISKLCLLIVLWTVGYWLCYGITYTYNAYFWDNKIISSLFFPAFCCYLLGIWLLSLLMLMSVLFRTNSNVIIVTFGIFLVIYLFQLLPDIESVSFFKECLPIRLLQSSGLLIGIVKPEEYNYAVLITVILSIINIVTAIICFQKKNIG